MHKTSLFVLVFLLESHVPGMQSRLSILSSQKRSESGAFFLFSPEVNYISKVQSSDTAGGGWTCVLWIIELADEMDGTCRGCVTAAWHLPAERK